MVTGLQLALHSASAETRYELVFAKSLARAPDALNPSLNLILLDLVYSIVSNLVSNAIRHAKHGRILIGTRRSGATVWVEVWDSGIGIPT
jgi:signal transduction histidine kinase